jgi:ribosomal protein S18 acetylase RimI-like enzyme|tara:strand:- start:56 stop:709 length:654 start_codon:yes stop_codon:yes gene_type:complete
MPWQSILIGAAMGFVTRPAQQADVQLLQQLAAESLHPWSAPSLAWWKDISSSGDDSDAHRRRICLVALDESAANDVSGSAGLQHPIGVIAAREILDDEPPGPRLHVAMLAVQHWYRRRGCARMLLRMLHRQALEWGLPCVSLYVRPDNAGAIHLYRDEGYDEQPMGVLKDYYCSHTDGNERADALMLVRHVLPRGHEAWLVVYCLFGCCILYPDLIH